MKTKEFNQDIICQKATIAFKQYTCGSVMERKRLSKVFNGILTKEITYENYWTKMKSYTKGIKTDSAIKEWQRIADYFYGQVF